MGLIIWGPNATLLVSPIALMMKCSCIHVKYFTFVLLSIIIGGVRLNYLLDQYCNIPKELESLMKTAIPNSDEMAVADKIAEKV